MAAATVTVYGYQIARDAAAAVVAVVARSVDALASRLAGVLATTGSWQQAAGSRQLATGVVGVGGADWVGSTGKLWGGEGRDICWFKRICLMPPPCHVAESCAAFLFAHQRYYAAILIDK